MIDLVNIVDTYPQRGTGKQTSHGCEGRFATVRTWIVGQWVRDSAARVVFRPLACFETEQEAEAAQRRMMG